MKKYKIETNGKSFRVKVKEFFFWREPHFVYEELIYFDFKTLKAAQAAVKEQEKADASAARPWRKV